MYMDLIDFQNMIWVILPLLVIQLSLMIIALRDWYENRMILSQNRSIWLIIILFFSMIGPIIYLLFSQRLIKKNTLVDKSMDDWSV
ncbi:MAG: PLDc N-terminal domain-containing protein [Candidatus Heimdallarchaeota archaeon]|nr:MAG: PLDc N-terminal domain-containing protein [Candidatus Heimdallarchaeota archaeon]